jgi:hypothetical protein
MTATRMENFDWTALAGDLDRQGWSVLPKLLTADECDAIASMYGDTPAFRSHIVMARLGSARLREG